MLRLILLCIPAAALLSAADIPIDPLRDFILQNTYIGSTNTPPGQSATFTAGPLCQSFNSGDAYLLTGVVAFFLATPGQSINQFILSILSDSGGSPGAQIWSQTIGAMTASPSGTVAPGMNIDDNSLAINPHTQYWLGFDLGGQNVSWAKDAAGAFQSTIEGCCVALPPAPEPANWRLIAAGLFGLLIVLALSQKKA